MTVATIRPKLCSVFQRYNSKAIHNQHSRARRHSAVVLSISKIQFKSNSQLGTRASLPRKCCAQYFKDTIQKQFTTRCIMLTAYRALCTVFQRYNSKAIHNPFWPMTCSRLVVLSISKIQFKSNSQPIPASRCRLLSCAQYFKDTIQKQFTTKMAARHSFPVLCSVFQRYNSKAIHNFVCHVC